MKFIDEKTLFVKGNLYTNMPLEPALLDEAGIIIHAKRDVFLEMEKKPNRMRTEDFYLNYEEFIREHGPIKDIIAFSKAFK